MRSMPREHWVSVAVQESQVSRIDQLVQEKRFVSRNAFVTEAVRRLLEEYRPRFEHYNTYEDHVTIKDNRLKRQIEVQLKEDCLWCEEDESTNCEHIQFALGLPQVKEAYQKKGLKNPEIT